MPLLCVRCNKDVPVYDPLPQAAKSLDMDFAPTRVRRMPLLPIVEYDEQSTCVWVFFQCQHCHYPNLYISTPLRAASSTTPK